MAHIISVLSGQVKIGSPSSHGGTLNAYIISTAYKRGLEHTTKSSLRFVIAIVLIFDIGNFLSRVVLI
jgi:acid phosphatase family membrane protein YuiD